MSKILVRNGREYAVQIVRRAKFAAKIAENDAVIAENDAANPGLRAALQSILSGVVGPVAVPSAYSNAVFRAGDLAQKFADANAAIVAYETTNKSAADVLKNAFAPAPTE